MIEQAMRSALLLLAGMLLSAVAWGQTVVLEQDNPQMVRVASEYFGSPDGQTLRLVQGNDNGAYAGITVTFTGSSASDMVDAGNEADITFTLTGATFAGPITANHLQYFVGGTENGAIARTLKSGGAVGDRTVTFSLSVETAITNVHTGGAELLWFRPPALQVIPAVLNARAVSTGADPIKGATIRASIQPTTSRANPFPADIFGASDAVDSNSNRIIAAVPDGNDDSIVVRLYPALAETSLGASTGNVATVDADNRKVIASGTPVTLTAGARPVQGLTVGALTIDLATADSATTTPRTLTANVLSVTAAGLDTSLAGTADLTVTGPFQDGDRVLLGADQTEASAKQFEVNVNNNTATLSVQIEELDGVPVIYVPGAVADLTPAQFNAALALDFNRSGAADREAASSRGTLSYANISLKAYAYGIVRGGGLENTFLRVTCSASDRSGMCPVFLDCTDQGGNGYFGQLQSVGRDATGVFTNDQIAQALGGGWDAGRGRCDLLSSGTLEVQHMVRSGGIQVNNSVVIGGDGILDK